MRNVTAAPLAGHPATSSCNRIAIYTTGTRSVRIPLPDGIEPRSSLTTPLGTYTLVAVLSGPESDLDRMWEEAQPDITTARLDRVARLLEHLHAIDSRLGHAA